MKVLRQFFCLAAGVLLLGAGSIAANAQSNAQQPTFTTLANPLPPSQKGKVDVVEIFWYGCSHCMTLEPFVESLQKKLPSDVVLSRAHISNNASQEFLLKLNATLKTMGLEGKLNSKVFEYIQTKRKPLVTDSHAANFLKENNVDVNAFNAASKSLTTLNTIAQAKAANQAASLDFVPAFIVGGKYVTAPSYHSNFESFQQTLLMLIEKSRAERAK